MSVGMSKDQVVMAVKESVKGTLEFPAGMILAQGTVTFSDVPAENGTFTIGTQPFSWEVTRTGAGEVTIGASASACVTNLITAIGLDLADEVTAADGALDTVVVTAIAEGRAGNAIVFSLGTATNMTMNGTGYLGGTTAGHNGQQVLCIDQAQIDQEPGYEDSPEIIEGERDIRGDYRFQNQIGLGTWSLTFLLRMDAAGQAPQGSVFFECLQGLATTTPATSIVYSQQESRPSLSLWVLEGEMLKWASGCAVEKIGIDLTNKQTIRVTASGRFMKMGWAATDALSGDEAAGQTTLSVDLAKKYAVGSRIENLTTSNNGDNSGAGFRITAVDTTNNTITVTPAVPSGGWSNNDVIAPFLPARYHIGTPISGAVFTTTFGGSPKNLSKLALSLDDPVYFFEDELTTSGYVEDFCEAERGTRNLSVDLEMLSRTDDAIEIYNSWNNVERAFEVIMGNVAGKRLKVSIPYGRLVTPPKQAVAGPTLRIPATLKGYGVAGGAASCTITTY
jgi:hypothetical protein